MSTASFPVFTAVPGEDINLLLFAALSVNRESCGDVQQVRTGWETGV